MTITEERRPAQGPAETLSAVAGIFDPVGNHGFLRTGGYLPAPGDPHVPQSQIRRLGLRKGDLVEGAVAHPREGERRTKPLPLVRVDLVNGCRPEELAGRPHFAGLTPLFPTERLRLETAPGVLATRVVDLVAPIGKGTRGLVVAPPKSGKTMVLQALANAVVRNHPECHLMVVMIDERPEEVTEMRRSVPGEVIASTFDRPAKDHTAVADLAVERAKRLVEAGRDVVVLLDSLTRLCRAHNTSAHSGGRILTGGVDATALTGPKRLFGAARNIEEGGSLTMLATALVDTGSRADDYYFEELKSTGNMELRLDRSLADKRIFPAVDVTPSGTRREELLLTAEELAVVRRLRRVLLSRDPKGAAELLIGQIQNTASNAEFLLRIDRTTPAA